MVAYRCYFARVDLSPMLQTVECDQDGDAIARATALLYTKPKHSSVEVWKDALLVARVARSRSPQHLRGVAS